MGQALQEVFVSNVTPPVARRPVQPKVASRLHSLLVLLLVNVGAGACVSLAYAISAEAQVTGDKGYMPWQVCGPARPLECSQRLDGPQQRLPCFLCSSSASSLPCQLEALPRLWTMRSFSTIDCHRLSALPFALQTAERAGANWSRDQTMLRWQ